MPAEQPCAPPAHARILLTTLILRVLSFQCPSPVLGLGETSLPAQMLTDQAGTLRDPPFRASWLLWVALLLPEMGSHLLLDRRTEKGGEVEAP